MQAKQDISLKKFTTIGLGGRAKFFVECTTREQIASSIEMATGKKLPFFVLGGGSNVIFSDKGFNGLVIKVVTKGVIIKDNFLTAEAGESWDDVVLLAVQKGLAGVECLSGIPGSVGATPIQNVGAYGQEVGQVIKEVEVLNCETLQIKKFSNKDCKFDYRTSYFKKNLGKYIILSVTFELKKSKYAKIKYKALAQYLIAKKLKKTLQNTREAVLDVRASKSMVLNKKDPNTRSCGSFFINPIVDKDLFLTLSKKYPSLSAHQSNGQYKISAGWLIEEAGFKKGFVYKNVGISTNHSLALITKKQATTKELLELEDLISSKIYKKFNIKLKREPVLA